ncbi:uncharacterized protein LOC131293263 [Anopheles ziemanni]|uniref:uncharacterized protein LOC131264138 n=1 Tax=Anopheles coustani TaxID=139045 RepID=UPI00265B1A57|nr:uncharacterized protein LOC131264138 [Anopheles coustani]XP_058177326.1 uncharacterized protein LOC131293263 [Anopheles ziemanni]
MAAHTYSSINHPANGIVRFSLLLLSMGMLGVAFACNGGYKITLKKIENCAGPDAVITVDENFTVVLNENCEIQTSGCVHIKDFKTGKAAYAITKSGRKVLQSWIDICDNSSASFGMELFTQFLRSLGVPESCPMSARTSCIEPSQAINISAFKQYLRLVRGAIDVEVAVLHDSGESCLKISFDVTK